MWINRYLDDPKGFDVMLGGRSVLVYEPRESEPDDSSVDHRLRTSSGSGNSVIGGGAPVVAMLEKAKDNMFQRRVTLGRTANNDIVLEDASVSRFHGWLQKEDEGEKWSLTDAGSKNGTWVSGLRLAPKKPQTLIDGARLKVGNLELTFHSAKSFKSFLEQRAAS